MTTQIRACAVGLFVAALAVTVFAQEPQTSERGLLILRGNVVADSGIVFSGGGVTRDARTATAITANVDTTYTAAQVLTGWIVRSGMTPPRTDAMPTAANLIAAMPGAVAGTSFQFTVQATNPLAALNGASSGVTYSTPCASALTTGGLYTVRVIFTSASAYTVLCK